MDRALRDSLAQVEDRHWWFVGRRQIIRTLLETHSASGPLLEVGCGSGANLPMLADFGDVVGIEPDATDRERANSRGAGRILPGALPDGIPTDELFETVLALDVIEHVEDDVASVQALTNRLRPGGLLIVTVPAYQWLWSEHDRVNGHFRRYHRADLSAVLEPLPLKIELLSYFNTLLLPAVALVRTAGRIAGLDGAGTELPPSRLNSLLTKVLASEAGVLARRSLPAGVSLVAVARRI